MSSEMQSITVLRQIMNLKVSVIQVHSFHSHHHHHHHDVTSSVTDEDTRCCSDLPFCGRRRLRAERVGQRQSIGDVAYFHASRVRFIRPWRQNNIYTTAAISFSINSSRQLLHRSFWITPANCKTIQLLWFLVHSVLRKLDTRRLQICPCHRIVWRHYHEKSKKAKTQKKSTFWDTV